MPYLGKLLFSRFLTESSRPTRSLDISNYYIFWTVHLFFIIFCIKIEYHKTFKMLSFFWKNAFLPWKSAKRSKSGQSSWKKSTFLYCSKLTHLILLIFCMKLETIKGYKFAPKPFFKKNSHFANFGHFRSFLAEKWTFLYIAQYCLIRFFWYFCMK